MLTSYFGSWLKKRNTEVSRRSIIERLLPRIDKEDILFISKIMFTFDTAISPEHSFEIEKAISYLVISYNKSGHNSKPVVLHSIRVATLLMEMGYDKKIICSAVLHDIIEDTDVDEEDLGRAFGEDILQLVLAVSYDEAIENPIEQYKDMYHRIMSYGREAVILKAVDMAVNSLYLYLVTDVEKRRMLVEKGTYFLHLTKEYSGEPAWQLLEKRNSEEIIRLS